MKNRHKSIILSIFEYDDIAGMPPEVVTQHYIDHGLNVPVSTLKRTITVSAPSRTAIIINRTSWIANR